MVEDVCRYVARDIPNYVADYFRSYVIGVDVRVIEHRVQDSSFDLVDKDTDCFHCCHVIILLSLVYSSEVNGPVGDNGSPLISLRIATRDLSAYTLIVLTSVSDSSAYMPVAALTPSPVNVTRPRITNGTVPGQPPGRASQFAMPVAG